MTQEKRNDTLVVTMVTGHVSSGCKWGGKTLGRSISIGDLLCAVGTAFEWCIAYSCYLRYASLVLPPTVYTVPISLRDMMNSRAQPARGSSRSSSAYVPHGIHAGLNVSTIDAHL